MRYVLTVTSLGLRFQIEIQATSWRDAVKQLIAGLRASVQKGKR